jgi:hypothetical protein
MSFNSIGTPAKAPESFVVAFNRASSYALNTTALSWGLCRSMRSIAASTSSAGLTFFSFYKLGKPEAVIVRIFDKTHASLPGHYSFRDALQ